MGSRSLTGQSSKKLILPAPFKRRIIEVHGDSGTEWLTRLPHLIAECELRWSLQLLRTFPLSYNFVAPAVTADGRQVVLKIGVPNLVLSTEIAALKIYGGRGAVMLLDADPDRGILLLEQLQPGTPLSQHDNDQQITSIAAGVMRQLWVPGTENQQFPTVGDWAEGLKRLRKEFNGRTGPFPKRLVEKAETLFSELLSTMDKPVLLHGDLHHENILSAERQPWLAIDPQGVIGEPAYETGSLLRNPMPAILKVTNLKYKLRRRVDQLADELALDRKRILGWGIAQAVLSAWWEYEDQGRGWEKMFVIAETLEAID